MKKITLLLMAVLVCVGAVSAQEAQSAITFNWAHNIEGAVNSGNNCLDMVKSSDGSYLLASKFGSKTGSLTLKFDGEVVDGIVGSPYTGNSSNDNLLLQKVSNAGSVAWNVYTRKGDVSTVCLAATSDGGNIIALKSRAWVKEAGYDNLLEVVDAASTVTTIKDMGTVAGEYRFLILKIDADGKLVWSRLVSGLVKTYGDKSTVDNAYLNACVVDADDNIYLGGNFRSELHFKKSDGSVETLVAKSTPDAYFDTQMSVGDLFLAKLDKDGYYVNSLITDNVTYASIDQMAFADGKIYLDARLQGKEATVAFADKSVAANASYQNLLVASVNASDLSVNYAKVLFPVLNSSKKFVIQNKGAQVDGETVYFTGSLNGGLSNELDGKAFVETGSIQLKGYVVKMDAATGEVAAQVMKDGGISNFFGVYPCGNAFYAFGYDMASGAILTPFDKASMEAGSSIVVAKGKNIAAAATPIIDGENLIMMNRGQSQQSYSATDVLSAKVSGYSVFFYSYKVNSIATAISAAKADAAKSSVSVYTTDGILMKTVSSVAEAMQGLSKGIYVIGGQKVRTH